MSYKQKTKYSTHLEILEQEPWDQECCLDNRGFTAKILNSYFTLYQLFAKLLTCERWEGKGKRRYGEEEMDTSNRVSNIWIFRVILQAIIFF